MRRTILIAAALFALLTAAATAGGDRNRDRIPDRWERQHDLSLKVKQTRRDQDRDGVDNLHEWRGRTDPRDKDSDDDGVRDDEENAGTIVSFDPATGELVIEVARDGSQVSGTVTRDTEIECPVAPTATAAHDDDDDDSDSGPGSGGDDDGDCEGDDDDGDHDDGDHDDRECGTDALVAGAAVREADLTVRADGTRVWREVELKAAS